MIELIRARRSVRKFAERQVEPEKVNILIEAMLRSPSSRGLNPWEFIVIDSSEILTDLSKAKPHGATFLAKTPLAIVVIANPEICDVWIEDCSIVSIFAQLAAESIGLKSCWTQMRLRNYDDNTTSEDYIRQLLNIPESYTVPVVIGVGYPEEELMGHPEESLQFSKVHKNCFGNSGVNAKNE